MTLQSKEPRGFFATYILLKNGLMPKKLWERHVPGINLNIWFGSMTQYTVCLVVTMVLKKRRNFDIDRLKGFLLDS